MRTLAARDPAADRRPGDCPRAAQVSLRRVAGRCALLCLLELPALANGGGAAAAGEGVAAQDRGAAPERGLVVDDADVEQVKCPEPDVPTRYEVNQVPWAFLDTYILEHEGKELGSIVRTLFSFTSAYKLYDTSARAWASVERTGDGLQFADCAGMPIAAASMTQAGGILGSPAPELDIATANGEVVGKTSAEGTSVSIEDTGGNIFARIQQDSWIPISGVKSQLLVIDPDGGGGDTNSIDQRTDPRVLSLLVANRLGSPISVVRPTGPIWELILAIGLPILLCEQLRQRPRPHGGGGCAYRCCKRRRRGGGGGGWLDSGGLLGGGEDYSSDSEDGHRRGGILFCCSKGRPPPRTTSSRFF